MEFILIDGPHGDCCSDYKVIGASTIRQLLSEILIEKPNEWGSIEVLHLKDIRIEYKYGKVISNSMSDELMDKPITMIKANGGYTFMAYYISLSTN